MPDLSDTIASAAGGPQAAQTGAGSMTARSLRELIEADRYLKACQAAGVNGGGIYLTQLVPGGGINPSPDIEIP